MSETAAELGTQKNQAATGDKAQLLESIAMARETLTAEEMAAIRVRDELIDRWGLDTISLFNSSVADNREPNPADILCITTLTVCSTYCKAIMLLLASRLRMPAQALLRVLFEVSTKVLWCLHKPGPDKSDSAVEERIQRWRKASLGEGIKLSRDYSPILTGQRRVELEQEIREYEELRDRMECEPMPRFIDMLRELGNPWREEFYPRAYRRLNNAVHLDFGSLCGKAKDDGSTVSVTNDIDEPVRNLAQYAVVSMHVVFGAIRLHYRWPVEEMNIDFKSIP